MFEVGQLNPAQRAAVTHRGDPLLIVAGAGTGKTKTLVNRVGSLLDEGVDPSRIMLLTFSRRAATEMLNRVAAAGFDGAAETVWGGTFHAVANRLLQLYGGAAGLGPGFTVLDQADATEMFKLVRTEEGFGERARRFPKPDTIAGIYSRVVNAQAKLGDVLRAEFPWCAPHEADLAILFGAYTRRKRASDLLDYDDLLLFWRGLLANPEVGPSIRTRFDHVLVDEYQDTNPIQADIVAGMIDGDRTSVCAVGDDAQSIYGFRSATVTNMWEFTDRFGGTHVTLEENYRSTPQVLAAANALLATSTDHLDKTLRATRGPGPQPKMVTCEDEATQSRVVVDEILEARERGIDLIDQAVLFRSSHHSDHLELELARRDVPFVKFGGLNYLEAAHIKDLMSLLRVLDNPLDELAWNRSLSLIDGVGPSTVRKVGAELGLGRDPSALQRFVNGEAPLPPRAGEQAAELIAAWADCGPETLSVSEQLERLTPFLEMVLTQRYDNSQARLRDVAQLTTTAQGYDRRSRFLTELTLDPPSATGDLAGPPHLDDDWLTLSTIHSAKGAEWDRVHVIHAADGNIPSDMALSSPDGLAEELRLLYVAMTRARDELTVTIPLRYHVNRYGNDDRHLYAQPSRFLTPIAAQFDQVAAVATSDPDATVEVSAVGVADEVDAMLEGLWS